MNWHHSLSLGPSDNYVYCFTEDGRHNCLFTLLWLVSFNVVIKLFSPSNWLSFQLIFSEARLHLRLEKKTPNAYF